MPLIIAATDFSKTGDNAVKYACNLAVAKNSTLLVIHTYLMPVMFTDIPVPNNLINDAQKDAETQMSQLVAGSKGVWPGLVIDGRVIYGAITDGLEEYKDKDKAPWLVIIGNNNTMDTTSFESTVMETFKGSRYPVLAVPPLASYKPVSRICFAYDNNYEGSEVALQQLKNLQQLLNAELHVLYAQADVHNQDNTADINEATKAALAPASPQYHFRYATSIENAITAFVEERHIDWLAIMPRKHSFFESIFHKSHVKTMAHEANIPIVALHEHTNNK